MGAAARNEVVRKAHAAARSKKARHKRLQRRRQAPAPPKWHEYCEVETSMHALKGRCRAYKRFCRLYKNFGMDADAKKHCARMRAAHNKLRKRAAAQAKMKSKTVDEAEKAAAEAEAEDKNHVVLVLDAIEGNTA